MHNTRRAIRSLAPIFCSLIALGAMTGCGSDDDSNDAAAADVTAAVSEVTAAESDDRPATDEPVRIGLFILSAANTYSQAHVEGAEEAADELNAEIQVFDGEFDPQTQITQVQNAITSGRFDAFVIAPNDGASIAPAVEEAIEAGITVISIFAPIGQDPTDFNPQLEGVLGTVASKNSETARGLADETIAYCEDIDPCRGAFVVGGFDQVFEAERLNVFEEIIADHPNIELVARIEGGYAADPALSAMQNVLQANPELDFVVSGGDQMTRGVETAIDEAGRTGVALISTGGTATAAERIGEGRWRSSYIYLPVTEGRIGAEFAIRASRGEDVGPVAVDVTAEYSTIGVNLTAENVGDFAAEWDG